MYRGAFGVETVPSGPEDVATKGDRTGIAERGVTLQKSLNEGRRTS